MRQFYVALVEVLCNESHSDLSERFYVQTDHHLQPVLQNSSGSPEVGYPEDRRQTAQVHLRPRFGAYLQDAERTDAGEEVDKVMYVEGVDMLGQEMVLHMIKMRMMADNGRERFVAVSSMMRIQR